MPSPVSSAGSRASPRWTSRCKTGPITRWARSRSPTSSGSTSCCTWPRCSTTSTASRASPRHRFCVAWSSPGFSAARAAPASTTMPRRRPRRTTGWCAAERADALLRVRGEGALRPPGDAAARGAGRTLGRRGPRGRGRARGAGRAQVPGPERRPHEGRGGAVRSTPEEAEAAAAAILALEIGGQRPRGVLVERRAPVAREYFVAVTWDGRRKLPVIVFSDMGGIDVEEIAERHPEHVSRTHVSTLFPFTPYRAKEAVAAVGVTGEDLNRITPIVAALVELFLRYDLTLAEVNPLGKTEDGRFVVLDGHVDLEADAREKHARLLAELGIGRDETREARPPTPFELRGAEIDASDH